MSVISGRRKFAACVVAATALSSLSTLAAASPTGPADRGRDKPPSTPVPIATPDGMLMSYVLNAKRSNKASVQALKQAVRRADGTVVKGWPQIGVVVAHSESESFRADVQRAAGKTLASVGATRTTAVLEGTPGDPGTAARRADQEKPEGEVGTERTRRVVPDPREGEQWDLRMIKADRAQQAGANGRGTLVGVLDSGIDADHPDLAENIDTRRSVNCTEAGRPDRSATGWQPTTSDHGTHVAGTIAAPRNGVGIVGVAPKAKMASVKVVSDEGYIYPEYAVCGFMWAGLRGMDVTNNSYFVDPFEFWCSDQKDQFAAKEAVRRAVAWSTKKGVVHAAAAGNSSYDLANKTTDASSPNDSTPVNRTINQGCQDIPTELDGVVTVSSLEQFPEGSNDSRLSGLSNRGVGVIDVAAPGSRILSTIVAGNGYGLKSGTSMASPHVAGVLALMKAAHPRWKPAKMINELGRDADDKACSAATAGAPCVGPRKDNSYFGDGVVDAYDATR